VKHQSKASGMEGNAAEKIARASQFHERVDQPDEVAPQCKTQPKQ